jgi:DEAD/DEAH box helicase domain-containing protein
MEVRHGIRFIAFCGSRKMTELILSYTQTILRRKAAGLWPGREALGDGEADLSTLVTSYRGGYTPEARREIESDIKTGGLVGVCATNALELGIDIGGPRLPRGGLLYLPLLGLSLQIRIQHAASL